MSVAAAVLAVAGLALTLPLTGVQRPSEKPKTAAPARTPTPPALRRAPTPAAAPASWKEVDRLVNEQKFEEASRAVDTLLASAKARQDSSEWTKALIRSVQIRTGLHGYETAVRFLKDEPWPPDLLSRTALELFYAQALVKYVQMYSWEISQRERVESTGKVDLKAWTREQIYDEAARSYVSLWKDRQALGHENVEALAEFVQPNDYPPGIRSTLRDALTYFFASLLADSGGWTPAQSNAVYALDVAGLLRADAASTASIRLDDPAVHPLERLVAVLADLEGWHAGKNEREAAFEARLERARRLHAAFTEDDDQDAIERDLEHRLPAMADRPWFAMGQAQLAEFLEGEDEADALVRARAAAEAGRRAYPDTIGGQRCLAIRARIEAPSYDLQSMDSDGAGRRSILVTHRNVERLELRAYALNLPRRLETVRDMQKIFPQRDEAEKILANQRPVATWVVSLPATPDYHRHRTFVVPPMKEKGLYFIAASGAFGSDNFPVSAASFLVSDLVFTVSQVPGREPDGGTFDVTVLSGDDGRPVSGATVELLLGEWNPERIARSGSATTGADGRVELPFRGEPHRGRRFLYARQGADLAIDLDAPYWNAAAPARETTASLVFTDRSIYRPQQKILWKALAYRGDVPDGRLAVDPHSAMTVTLYDQNNQAVESKSVTTNAFGTAAGEFPIPTGRALGAWRVSTSLGGADASVRVEEYKRPTFEVTLKDPTEPMRLNRPARLTGEARYYFGLPVASGSVQWRVTRTPQFPWWFWWRGWGGAARTETVAAGTSALQADGTFTVAFTPEADERLAQERRGLTYSYTVDADASDDGGETRSASRTVRLGFVAVEARVQLPGGFLRAGTKEEIEITRTSLDGAPRPGKGSWRIVRLAQPASALLPADLPPDPAGESRTEGAYRTPGDALRARWETSYSAEQVMASWKAGAQVAKGHVTHDAKGIARIPVDELAPGAYRLLYATRDEFGAEYEAPREFIVAGASSERGAAALALAAVLLAEDTSVSVGQTARLLATSGIPGQTLLFEIDRDGRAVERRTLVAGESPSVIEIPIGEKDRGGFGVKLTVLRDHQLVTLSQSVFVPWDDKQLQVSFSTFRDRLRPGQTETWTLKVAGPKDAPLEKAAAELLAYMYDRSLDAFVPHHPPSVMGLYPNRTQVSWARSSLGTVGFVSVRGQFPSTPAYPSLRPDALKFYGGWAMGGPGRRGVYAMAKSAMASDLAAAAPVPASAPAFLEQRQNAAGFVAGVKEEEDKAAARTPEASPELRANFSETAFWKPQLLTGADGTASIEFTVPDSVTAWNVWVHAVTKDLKSGALQKETKSVKELMVRPYVPRFLREGDVADLKVVVNNASEKGLSGRVQLAIVDMETSASALAEFGLSADRAALPFSAAAGAGSDVTFHLTTPKRVGSYAFEARAVSGEFSDGERRPVPVLPGRMQLAQSRFAALRGGEKHTLTFADMAKSDDPSRIDEQLVVTIDGQLFYSVLSALPYLVNYPYECTEQTLNRFLSTGIVSSVFKDYPSVAAMAQELSRRDTQLEPWEAADPNRRMTLEETPWLEEAKGGKTGPDLTRVLDPRIAKADRDTAIAKLRKAQTDSGGFPWWPGGPPSPYMTLYILSGFSHALEFGVEVPKDMVQRAFRYAGADLKRDLESCMSHGGTCEFVTYVNYVLSSYPDEGWYGGAFDAAYRKTLLDYSFAHWKGHSPYLKGQLALTLHRMKRPKDAKLVWDSVMDAAKTDPDLGTSFAPEDRSWLWYNDTIETQAFTLRVLAELDPADSRRHGLVQWLFLNKKMNQWSSTRATAEVIYALVWYLRKEGALAVREDVTVSVASQKTTFVFEPDRYTGKRNQVVVPGEKMDPKRDSQIGVEKTGKGLAFASATWHFSTEKLPEDDRGDFFSVSRKYFLRASTPSGFVLRPLAEGAVVQPGDEIEVQISLRSKHAAEYVHLRDPRPAGAEPQNVLSRYKWDLGISWYEEMRDSGANFFFEWLPAGEYTFKHRIRANMAGTFRVSPATVQSMYAPEFNAYSAGNVLRIGSAGAR